MEKDFHNEMAELLNISASLLNIRLSDFSEDWPKSMPKVAMTAISGQGEKLRVLAIRTRSVYEALTFKEKK